MDISLYIFTNISFLIVCGVTIHLLIKYEWDENQRSDLEKIIILCFIFIILININAYLDGGITY